MQMFTTNKESVFEYLKTFLGLNNYTVFIVDLLFEKWESYSLCYDPFKC